MVKDTRPAKPVRKGGEGMRVFLAVEVPLPIIKNIQKIQDILRRQVQGAIRWVRPEGVHLTLKFFGEVSSEEAGKIITAAAERTVTVPPFELEARGLGVFPDVNRPRVIWLGIAGEVGPLLLLQRELEETFGRLGFPKEERPFRAHLTLGRIKVPRGVPGLAGALEAAAAGRAGSFRVEEAALFQSELTPGGAIYTRLASFPLRGREG